MTTDTHKPEPPPLPSSLHMLAILLEVMIFGTFMAHKSILGMLLCAAYFWWSATYAALFGRTE